MPSLEKTILHYPVDVSASDMNSICFALYKEAIRELDAGKFFEIPQFYVCRIVDDLDEDALVRIILFISCIKKSHHLHISYTMFFVFLVRISRLR